MSCMPASYQNLKNPGIQADFIIRHRQAQAAEARRQEALREARRQAQAEEARRQKQAAEARRQKQAAEARRQDARREERQQEARREQIAEIVKKDCQKLVDGELLFEPSKSMRQGQSYSVFARLSRSPGINITEGLDGSGFVIVRERVSCKVSMSLDSEEPKAFIIEKVPADRKDEQFLEPNKFSQWDWRVTPQKHGTLHLLLYVTPLLYVEDIGEALKQFRQPPRIITVTPDYLYGFGVFLKDNWVIISGLLTAIIIPLLLWFRTQIIDWFKKHFKKKEVFYELPPKGGES
jgi:hypothetical protein